jgi:predicted secreted hydrolase
MTKSAKALFYCLAFIAFAGCSGDETATRAGSPPGLTGIRYLSSVAGSDDGFARAVAPPAFEFPADHGPHPDFRTEWWYFTGNVFDANGRHYGFELTIFRIALGPPGAARVSTLASNEIWMANLAITDTARKRFQAAERLSRGATGLAGVRSDDAGNDAPLVIGIEDWQLTIANDTIVLTAFDDGFGLALELTGLERIVAQGDAGLDPKGPEPGNASYYYSAPRLAVRGEISSGGTDAMAVAGSAWMDREWSTSALAPDLAGWDWFALQLDDGRDLMFYRLRGDDGSTSPFSGGSLTDAAGDTLRLDAAAVGLVVTREWTSRNTAVRYPVAWRMSLPAQDMELKIEPWLDDQELDLSVRYWEGAVHVSGRAGGRTVSGQGYLELAGY